MTAANTLETRAVVYHLEIPIEAPPAKVWAALVDETNAWWLPDFHMTGPGSVVSFDAQAGGQLIERHEDGGSLLWYTVQYCRPQEQLSLTGGLHHRYGGPATTMLDLVLEPRGTSTVLKLSDALFGHVAEPTVDSLTAGWRQLMTDGLKAHAES